MNWLEIVPSSMSAVASVAAAIAAIASWRASNRANNIAESAALATHHNSASIAYFEESSKLTAACHHLENLSTEIISTWPKQIQRFDKKDRGGIDPRPLRHVLYNGSEMLATHASVGIKSRGDGHYSLLSPLRNGMGVTNETEYKQLLKKADKAFSNFETVFGAPSKTKSITSALAFRWVYYQLLNRVDAQDWHAVWVDAWQEECFLARYVYEYQKIKPVLVASRERLKNEQKKLLLTAFPIKKNSNLSNNYEQILGVLDCLIEDCDLELMDVYKEWNFTDEQCLLVLCSMGIAHFTSQQIDKIRRQSSE
ncbi:hypothetical protein [Rheinheimera aquimaris]|uniref:hypothetical protein n=1 Tax=Rheinheimera aquimaris TaxID=412437 RepID=UPI003A96BB2A